MESWCGPTPHGVGGLKWLAEHIQHLFRQSHPARGGWIEIRLRQTSISTIKSHPARGGWIEISGLCDSALDHGSHPARGGWSEMLYVPSVSFVIARRGRAPDRSETRGRRRPAGALCSSAAFRQRFSILHNRSLAAPRSSAMSWLFLLRADLSAILPASLPVCKVGLPPHVFQNSSSGGIRINPHCLQTIAMY